MVILDVFKKLNSLDNHSNVFFLIYFSFLSYDVFYVKCVFYYEFVLIQKENNTYVVFCVVFCMGRFCMNTDEDRRTKKTEENTSKNRSEWKKGSRVRGPSGVKLWQD